MEDEDSGDATALVVEELVVVVLLPVFNTIILVSQHHSLDWASLCVFMNLYFCSSVQQEAVVAARARWKQDGVLP